MSLDVYILGKAEKQMHRCHECGHEYEAEVRERYYDSNITHNLARMAEAAGIYKHLWRPEEIGITKASELIEPLKNGLQLLKSDPVKFKTFNASNGWGKYEDFVGWVEDYLNACVAHPDGEIEASR